VQGRSAAGVRQLLRDARALDEADARRFPAEEHTYGLPEAERPAVAHVVEEFTKGLRPIE